MRRFIQGASVTVFLVALAGCGGSGAHVSSNYGVAVRRLSSAAAGRMTMGVSFVGPNGESVPPVVYTVRFDNGRRLGETKIDFRAFVAVYNKNVPKSQRLGDAGLGVIDLLMDSRNGLVMYMSSPLFRAASFQQKLPRRLRGRPWLEFRFKDFLSHGAELGPALASQLASYAPGFGSPVAYLKPLAGGSAKVGMARVEGVETNTYAKDVNFRSELDLLPTFLSKIVRATSGNMRAVVSVDGSSNVRRVQLTSGPVATAGGARIIVTFDHFVLGQHLSIATPPKQQVVDPAALHLH